MNTEDYIQLCYDVDERLMWHKERFLTLLPRKAPFSLWRDVHIILAQWSDTAMARKAIQPKTAPKANAAWGEFVDIPLSGVSKIDLDREFGDPVVFADAVEGLLLDGYKLSLYSNKKTNSLGASLTCRDEESPNMGKTVTSFGRTWQLAVGSLLYKHFVIAEGDWTGTSANANAGDFG